MDSRTLVDTVGSEHEAASRTTTRLLSNVFSIAGETGPRGRRVITADHPSRAKARLCILLPVANATKHPPKPSSPGGEVFCG